MCFEARDTLHACVDAQDNGNKYRCPDELYAYEMWCPTEMRRITSHDRVQEQREATMFTQAGLDAMSRRNQTI